MQFIIFICYIGSVGASGNFAVSGLSNSGKGKHSFTLCALCCGRYGKRCFEMPKSCCVTNCTTNKLKNPELSYYMIPSAAMEPRRRVLWIQAIRREAVNGGLWFPKSDYNYVCSKHVIEGKRFTVWHLQGSKSRGVGWWLGVLAPHVNFKR